MLAKWCSSILYTEFVVDDDVAVSTVAVKSDLDLSNVVVFNARDAVVIVVSFVIDYYSCFCCWCHRRCCSTHWHCC